MGNLNHEDIKMLATRLSGTLDLMEYVSIAVANEWTMERIIKSLRKERFKEKRVRSTVKLFLDTYENTTDKNRKAVVYRGILYCSVRKFCEGAHVSHSMAYKMINRGEVCYA